MKIASNRVQIGVQSTQAVLQHGPCRGVYQLRIFIGVVFKFDWPTDTLTLISDVVGSNNVARLDVSSWDHEALCSATGRNVVVGTGAAGFRSLIQRNSRLGLMPCRRATADTFVHGPDASTTMACFFAALQRRRVSATISNRREDLSPDIFTEQLRSRPKAMIRPLTYPARKTAATGWVHITCGLWRSRPRLF